MTGRPRIVHGSVQHRILQRLAEADGPLPAATVHAAAQADGASVRRMLTELVAAGRIVRTGRTRATHYQLAGINLQRSRRGARS